MSNTRIAELLEEFDGCVSFVAQQLGVNTASVYARIYKSKTLQAIVESKRREIVDVAEFSLKRRCMEGEGWAVKYALSTLGVRFGLPYAEEITVNNKVSGPNGGPVQHDLNIEHLVAHLNADPTFQELARSEVLEASPKAIEAAAGGNGKHHPEAEKDSDPGVSGGNGKSR